jgi:hypothetical protein
MYSNVRVNMALAAPPRRGAASGDLLEWSFQVLKEQWRRNWCASSKVHSRINFRFTLADGGERFIHNMEDVGIKRR